MDRSGFQTWLFDYEPHPRVRSAADLEAFHREVSVWAQLERRGVHPVAFAFAFTVFVVSPGLFLRLRYGLEYPLVSEPMLAVLCCNTVLTFVGVFFIDRRFPVVMQRIERAFDMPDEEYYGFVGRLFERLYHLSFYSPLAPGPRGRRHRPAFWVGLGLTYVGWAVVLAVAMPITVPASVAGQVLLVGYYLFVVAYGTFSLFTAVLFVSIVGLYLTVRASRFRVRLRPTMDEYHYGLKPFGRFIFQTLFIGFGMVATSGVIGVLTMNPLLLLFALLVTPLIVGWFAGSQYGLHYAIVDTKRAVLQQIQEKHAANIDRVFLDSTTEPGMDDIGDSDALITLKNEIRSLPDWPIDTRILIEAVSVTILSNLPSLLTFLV